MNTPTLWKMVDAELLGLMECETTVRIAGRRSYFFHVKYQDRPHFQKDTFEPRNLQPSEDNPLKYVFFRV